MRARACLLCFVVVGCGGNASTSSTDAGSTDATTDDTGARGDAGSTDAASDAREGGPPSDGASCASVFFAALEKTCSADGDCATANHDDCCGTVVVGIKAGTQAQFATAEQAFLACESGCGGRGCFHADTAEDGRTAKMGAPRCRATAARSSSPATPGAA
jgi:hypothetical protein